MNDRIYTIDEIKSIIAPIAEEYNLPAVYLFGSYARGEATEKSDIDLCVDASNLVGLFDLSALFSELREAFDKELDIITINSLVYNKNDRFVTAVDNDKIMVYRYDGKRSRIA